MKTDENKPIEDAAEKAIQIRSEINSLRAMINDPVFPSLSFDVQKFMIEKLHSLTKK